MNASWSKTMDKHEEENMNFWGMRLDEHEVQDQFYSESEKNAEACSFDSLFNFVNQESLVTMPSMKSIQPVLSGSGFHKTILYSKINGYFSKNSAHEACRIISVACKTCIDGIEFKGSDEMEICDNTFSHLKIVSNYEVVSIERVQNTNLELLHDTFNAVHQIGKPRTVYHGSTKMSIENIAKTGFRGSTCSRSKHGRGIYSSSNIWEALSYAEPEKDTLYQNVIVADLLQGPTIMGTPNLKEFGFNSANQEILTSTNAENTIFCAARESQLLTKYIIVFKFDQTSVHGEGQKNLIKFYNMAIWALIKKNQIISSAWSASNVVVTLPSGSTGAATSMAAIARACAKQAVLEHMAIINKGNALFSDRLAASIAAVSASHNSGTNTGNALFSAEVSRAIAHAAVLNNTPTQNALSTVAAAAGTEMKATSIRPTPFPVFSEMGFQRPIAPSIPKSVQSSIFTCNEPAMYHIQSHNNISIGDKVKICSNFKDMDFVLNCLGIVRSILKHKYVKFYIEIDDTTISSKMENYNKKCRAKRMIIEMFKLEMKWVPCNLGQITTLYAIAQHQFVDTAVGTKRPMSMISKDDP